MKQETRQTVFRQTPSEYEKWTKEIIDNLPPADVVPKSEVDLLVRDLRFKNIECNQLRERITKAKQEAAREIFEEIEKALSKTKYNAKTTRKSVKVEELIEQAEWILHEAVLQIIAPIKKKYTKESEDKG